MYLGLGILTDPLTRNPVPFSVLPSQSLQSKGARTTLTFYLSRMEADSIFYCSYTGNTMNRNSQRWIPH